MANPWNDPLEALRDQNNPTNLEAGFKIDRRLYPQRNVAPGNRSANDVFTRPVGYSPYQSVVQDDGRHAFNPSRDQYPQSSYEGNVTRALDPAARRQEFNQNRSDYYVHLPGEQVVMGIDESRMQPMPAAAFLPPNVNPPPGPVQQPAQQPMPQYVQRPISQSVQQPMRGQPLLSRPAARQGPVQGALQSPTRGPIRSPPTQGPMRGPPTQGPVRGPPMQGPMRVPTPGTPRGASGTRGGRAPPPLPQSAARGRDAGPGPRPVRGGYGNPQGNRGRRR
jgi:hypothetical protein